MQKYQQVWWKCEIWNMKSWLVPPSGLQDAKSLPRIPYLDNGEVEKNLNTEQGLAFSTFTFNFKSQVMQSVSLEGRGLTEKNISDIHIGTEEKKLMINRQMVFTI